MRALIQIAFMASLTGGLYKVSSARRLNPMFQNPFCSLSSTVPYSINSNTRDDQGAESFTVEVDGMRVDTSRSTQSCSETGATDEGL